MATPKIIPKAEYTKLRNFILKWLGDKVASEGHASVPGASLDEMIRFRRDLRPFSGMTHGDREWAIRYFWEVLVRNGDVLQDGARYYLPGTRPHSWSSLKEPSLIEMIGQMGKTRV